ncbi:hypothetical protein WH47_00075 [Habropoda laboriosa]|uniref:Uncharacterized protein n=1 Tax=Habropoda laboriosa TaxID=597456 RepID=A0A0L7RKH6_9HYME|nr:hypothetical protein WH47_00075 [Habropoda laboriosa]
MLNLFSLRVHLIRRHQTSFWVYVNKRRTIEELKENIRAEIRRLGPETLRTVMQNAVERACICEQENGGHFGDVVFHTYY